MKSVFYNSMPVFCSHNMTDRIQIILNYHFWITRSSRSKIQKHWIFVVSSSFAYRTRKFCRHFFIFFVERNPAFSFCFTNCSKHLNNTSICNGLFNLFLRMRIIITDDKLNISSLNTIFDIGL